MTSRIATKRLEARQDVDSGPLDRGGEAAQDAGGEQPGASAGIGADHEAPAVASVQEFAQVVPSAARSADAVPSGELARQRWSGHLLVPTSRRRRKREHCEEAVEDRGAAS